MVGRAVPVEDAVVDERLHHRAVEQRAVVGERAVDEAAVGAAARAAALVGGVVDDEAVRGVAVVEAAAVARGVVADDAAVEVRVVGAAAVVGDVVLENALHERAPLRAAAAVLVVRADRAAVAQREAGEARGLQKRTALRAAAVDDRLLRARDAHDVHVALRRVDGVVDAGHHVDDLGRRGRVDGLLDRPERRGGVVAGVVVAARRGVHVPLDDLEARRDHHVAGERGERERRTGPRGRDAVRRPLHDLAVVGGGVRLDGHHRVRVREEVGRRDGAVAVRDRRHDEPLDARSLVAAAVDHGALHADVAGEVGRARLRRVVRVAVVDRGRADARAVVAVADELRVHGVVVRGPRAIEVVAPEDAVVDRAAAVERVVGGRCGVIHDRAVVERRAGDGRDVGRAVVDERVAVRALGHAAAVPARRRAAADDAAQRVGLAGAATRIGHAVLDDAVHERAARRAAAVLLVPVPRFARIAVAEREARERRRRRVAIVGVAPDAVVRVVAIDDGRGRAVHGADLEREVIRDENARVDAVRDEDVVDRAVRKVRGVGGVDGGLDAGEGVGPGRAVLVSGARGRHVERVRAERERRAEQREECEEGLFHGCLVVWSYGLDGRDGQRVGGNCCQFPVLPVPVFSFQLGMAGLPVSIGHWNWELATLAHWQHFPHGRKAGTDPTGGNASPQNRGAATWQRPPPRGGSRRSRVGECSHPHLARKQPVARSGCGCLRVRPSLRVPFQTRRSGARCDRRARYDAQSPAWGRALPPLPPRESLDVSQDARPFCGRGSDGAPVLGRGVMTMAP